MMKSIRGRSGISVPVCLVALGLLLALFPGCGRSASATRSGAIDHVVLCWLKNPGSSVDRQALVATAEELRTIPGVIGISAGPPLASDRDVVDDSFDVGFVITLESPDALEGYLAHPTHLAALRTVLAPLVAKIVVYDILRD